MEAEKIPTVSGVPASEVNAAELKNHTARRAIFDESESIKALVEYGAEITPTAGFGRDDFTIAVQTKGKRHEPTQYANPGDTLIMEDGFIKVVPKP